MVYLFFRHVHIPYIMALACIFLLDTIQTTIKVRPHKRHKTVRTLRLGKS